MNLNIPNFFPFFDNNSEIHTAVAVIAFGILILAVTFIIPVIGEIVLLLGILLIAFVVYRYFYPKTGM